MSVMRVRQVVEGLTVQADQSASDHKASGDDGVMSYPGRLVPSVQMRSGAWQRSSVRLTVSTERVSAECHSFS